MQKTFNSLRIIKDVFPFLWTKQEKIRYLLLISFCLIFFTIALDLTIPIVLKEVVYRLSSTAKTMTFQLSSLLVAYGVIWTLSQIIQQARLIIMVKPLERCIRLFCSSLFEHLHSLPMKFHLDRKTGAITNALERAQQGFPDVFLGLFLFIIPTIIELFLAAAVLCYFYGIIYGFILIVMASAFIIFTLYSTNWASQFQRLSNDQQSATNANIVDSLLNFASVKYFNNKEYEVLKCNSYLKKREKLLTKSILSMEFVRIGQSIIIGLGLIILTYAAGIQALMSIYDVSDFVLINGYILQFAAPLSHMGFIARDVRRGINELISIMKIYNTQPEDSCDVLRKDTKLEKLESIEFKNVSFGYDPSHLVLKDFSFKLQVGEMIGIVGATGSGKSTISNLIFKFFNNNFGKILVNNENLQNLNTESVRELLGIVPQDVTLFNTTIYENILLARPNASKEEVEQAIELAHLGEILKNFPSHYNTIVGERGLKISGGEKQRIAIARILLKRPSLYIFDEATSSLDLSTEEKIMQCIAPIIKNSMSIMIAHRLSTVVNANEILVLRNGVVEERGTHTFLLKKDGFYASLWKTQETYRESHAA